MEKLPAGGCTQERSQEESSISSPLTLSESACQRTHLLFAEVYFLLYNLVCSLPGALIPECPQITLAAYEPTTNAVISPLGRPGSWHILWFWPQFQYPPLEKLLISLLKAWHHCHTTTYCRHYNPCQTFPCQTLELVRSKPRSQSTESSPPNHVRTQKGLNSSSAVTLTQGALH